MESKLSVRKICRSTIQVATMRIVLVVEDHDFDEIVEQEEVIYVNDGIQISID